MTGARALLASLVFAACARDDSGRDTGPTSVSGATTTGDCPAGATGCPCHANGTCAPGLECAVEIDTCTLQDCDAGTLGCPCYAGDCLADLVCLDGVCRMANETTTFATGTDTATSGDTTGAVDTGAVECDPAVGCEACSECVSADNSMCAALVLQCWQDPECYSRYMCCSEFIDMCAGCCAETSTVSPMTWDPIAACVTQICTSCGSWTCQ